MQYRFLSGYGGHLGCPFERSSANFDVQVILMLSIKFRVNWPFSSGEEAQNRFPSKGSGDHLGFPIGTVLALVYLQ